MLKGASRQGALCSCLQLGFESPIKDKRREHASCRRNNTNDGQRSADPKAPFSSLRLQSWRASSIAQRDEGKRSSEQVGDKIIIIIMIIPRRQNDVRCLTSASLLVPHPYRKDSRPLTLLGRHSHTSETRIIACLVLSRPVS